MFTLGMVPIRPSPQKQAVGDIQGSSRPRDMKAQRPLLAASSSTADRKNVSYSAAYVPTIAPTTVLRRNARERNRVKQVNHGFAALRTHVPSAAKNKKMSKVETLRQAVEYIQALQEILREADSDGPTPQSPAASEDGGSSASVQGLSTSPSGSVTPVAPNSDPSPQTLTPASVSSVDSGYTDCSPGYYLSPHDLAAAASAQSGSNTGSLYLQDTQHSHHQQHMLVSPRCPEKHQQHMLVSPRCPEKHQQHMLVLPRCSEEHQQHMLVSPRCPDELQQLQHHQQMMSAMKHPLVSPLCSDASSPSPSYCSTDTPLPASSFDGIGFHDENISPQDEELLDAIAWWQTNQ